MSLMGKLKFNTTEEEKTRVLRQFDGSGILVIRNPFKAIVSYRNFMHGGMKGKAPPENFMGPGTVRIGREQIVRMFCENIKLGCIQDGTGLSIAVFEAGRQ